MGHTRTIDIFKRNYLNILLVRSNFIFYYRKPNKGVFVSFSKVVMAWG